MLYCRPRCLTAAASHPCSLQNSHITLQYTQCCCVFNTLLGQHAAGNSASARIASRRLAQINRLPTEQFGCRQHIENAGVRRCSTAIAGTSVQANAATGGAAAVALDVEYVHMMLPGGQEQSAPAWVALVDDQCKVLLKTYVRPTVPDTACCFGGVPAAAWAHAAPLSTTVKQLQTLAAGKLLIGHGLSKDLAALGMKHPAHLMYDTMTHPAFSNKAGNSRSLRQLAKAFLNVNIQQQPLAPQRTGAANKKRGMRAGRQQQGQQQRAHHDPEEDAAAVMQLYQKVVVPSTYEGQVAAATRQMLSDIQRHQQQLQHEQAEHGEPEMP